jgi:catecholate siderophore receptor
MDERNRSRAGSSRVALMAGLAMGGLFWQQVAQAQEVEEGQAAPEMLAPITVTGATETTLDRPHALQRMPITLQETPQTINVIPQEVIEEKQMTTLTDVVRTVPGITLNAGEGGGGTPGGDNFNIRGFSAQGDIFLDGFRDSGFYSRDTFNMEAVEVFKGPSGSLFGRSSSGGAINLTSKTPKKEFFAEGTASIGTGDYYRATVDINQPITDDAAFRLNVMGTSRGFVDRDYAKDKRYGIAPSLNFGIGDRTDVTISYLYQYEDNRPDYGIPYTQQGSRSRPADVNRSNYYGFKDDYEKTKAHVGTIGVEHDANDWLTLINTTRFGWYDRDRWVTPPRFNGGRGGGPVPNYYGDPCWLEGADDTPSDVSTDDFCVYRGRQSREMRGYNIHNQTTGIAEFETGSVGHTLSTTLDFSYEDYRQQNYTGENPTNANLPPLNLGNPGNPGRANQDRVKGASNDTWARSISLSLFDKVELTDQWSILGNIRYENYKADVSQTFDGGSSSFNKTYHLWSYQAAVEYSPTPDYNFYFSYGASQQPPVNPTQEFLGGNDQSDLAKRDPEETRTIELGTKMRFLDGRLGVGAAIFQIDKENMLTTDPFDDTQSLSGERRVRGVELQLDGNITPEWRVMAGYTYMRSTIKDDDPSINGNDMMRLPEHSGSVWTTYDVTPAFMLGGGATYVGPRWVNEGNTTRVPGHLQFDAMASYDLTENVALQLNAYNLTNEETYEQIHNAQVVPGPGRTFILSTRLRF